MALSFKGITRMGWNPSGTAVIDIEEEMREQARRIHAHVDMELMRQVYGRGPGVDMAQAVQFKETPIKIPKKPGTEMLQEAAAPEVDIQNGRVGLAIRSEDLLGYTPLRDAVKAPSKLTRLLAALEIRVYEKATVQEYKARMQAHYQALADKSDREETKKRGFGRTVTRCSWEMVRLSDYKKPVPEYVLAKCVEIKQQAPEAIFWVNELREEKKTLDPFMVVTLEDNNPQSTPRDVEHAYFEVWEEPEFEATL